MLATARSLQVEPESKPITNLLEAFKIGQMHLGGDQGVLWQTTIEGVGKLSTRTYRQVSAMALPYEERFEQIEADMAQLKSDVSEIKVALKSLTRQLSTDERAAENHVEQLSLRHQELDEEISSIKAALEGEMRDNDGWQAMAREIDGTA